MFGIIFTLGILGIIAILLFIGKDFNSNLEYLKLAFYGVVLLLVLILTGYFLQYEDCTYQLNDTNETYVYGNNFDGYHWDGYNTTAPPQIDKNSFIFHKNTDYNYDLYCIPEDYTEAKNLYMIWFILIRLALAGVLIAPLVYLGNMKYKKYKQQK